MERNPITQAAKELRQRQTKAEKKLWVRLRRKHLKGSKFRRQEPIGTIIVDFVNFENKLIVEIDGGLHREKESKINDNFRDQYLHSEGYTILRFWNSEVFNNFEKVIKKINQYLL